MNNGNKISCWTKFDQWSWNSSHFTREEKTENHLRGNKFINDTCLLIIRLIFLAASTFLLIYTAYERFFVYEEKFMHLQKLTVIGVILTWLYFLLIVIAYVK